MMCHDKKEIEKKIRAMKKYLSKNPGDKVAIDKLQGLEESLITTQEYIDHYSQVEKMVPQDKEKSDQFIRALRGGG